MGGDLTVKSELGRGSIFRLEIGVTEVRGDQVIAPEPARRVASLRAGQECRVLVVDDIADNRALLRALLGGAGFDVREAVDGQEA